MAKTVEVVTVNTKCDHQRMGVAVRMATVTGEGQKQRKWQVRDEWCSRM